MKKSLFEYIYTFTLDILSVMNFNTSKNRSSIIFCYHSVGNSGWRFTTKTSDFREQIAFITDNYKVISLKEFIKDKPKYNHAVITFDDGYEDVLKNAFPILEKNKITATIFVLGDYKRADRKELDNSLPIINYEKINFLHKKGWEIGFHTETHADIGNISDEKLEDEIINGKKKLESKLGFTIRYFAYPRGKTSDKIIKYVKNARFEAAFTVKGGVVSFENSYTITRLPMQGMFSQKHFAVLLTKSGQLSTELFMELLQIKQSLQDKIRNLV